MIKDELEECIEYENRFESENKFEDDMEDKNKLEEKQVEDVKQLELSAIINQGPCYTCNREKICQHCDIGEGCEDCNGYDCLECWNTFCFWCRRKMKAIKPCPSCAARDNKIINRLLILLPLPTSLISLIILQYLDNNDRNRLLPPYLNLK